MVKEVHVPPQPERKLISWETLTSPRNLELLRGKQILCTKGTLQQQTKIVDARVENRNLIITLDKTLEFPGRPKSLEFPVSTRAEQGGAQMLLIDNYMYKGESMRISIFPEAELAEQM